MWHQENTRQMASVSPQGGAPAGQQEPSARAGDDEDPSTDIIIKAGGIHSMAETDGGTLPVAGAAS
jgi:hypothetical protein